MDYLEKSFLVAHRELDVTQRGCAEHLPADQLARAEAVDEVRDASSIRGARSSHTRRPSNYRGHPIISINIDEIITKCRS